MYALQHTVKGELGKEGKKGAVSNGLKVRSPTEQTEYHLSRLSTIFPSMSVVSNV